MPVEPPATFVKSPVNWVIQTKSWGWASGTGCGEEPPVCSPYKLSAFKALPLSVKYSVVDNCPIKLSVVILATKGLESKL